MNALLNDLLPRAKRLLTELGEFYPLGSAMASDGKIVWFSAYDGDEHPPSQRLIDMMTQAFRQKASAGEIRAAGICYDVRTIPPGQTEKSDAVCMALEHQSGEFVEVYAPYRKQLRGVLSTDSFLHHAVLRSSSFRAEGRPLTMRFSERGFAPSLSLDVSLHRASTVMEHKEFWRRYREAKQQAIQIASSMIVETLPDIHMPFISFPMREPSTDLAYDERVFDRDDIHRQFGHGHPHEEQQMVEYFWRDGFVPRTSGLHPPCVCPDRIGVAGYGAWSQGAPHRSTPALPVRRHRPKTQLKSGNWQLLIGNR